MTDNLNKKRDFFISRTSIDSDWARWVAQVLEEAGYTTILQDRDFQPGQSFVERMEYALDNCEHTIVLLSPEYLAAEFTKPELRAAFSADASGKNRPFIPILLRPCKIPRLFYQYIYIDLCGKDEIHARNLLLNGVAETTQNQRVDFPHKDLYVNEATAIQSKQQLAARRDDSSPTSLRLFLSSSFLPIRQELAVVEETAAELGHTCIYFRHFGNHPFTVFKNRVDAIQSADILLVVIKHEAAVPRRKTLIKDLKAELKAARKFGLEVLAYVDNPTEINDEVNSPEMRRIRGMVSDWSATFWGLKDAQQHSSAAPSLRHLVAADLARVGHDIGSRLIQESSPELVARHLEVSKALGRKAFEEALELNNKILETYPSSVRALYNSACIYSLLASMEGDPQRHRLLLLTARHKLADAIESGILKFIRLSKGCPDRAAAVEIVLGDTDLERLFHEFAELPSLLKNGRPLRFVSGGGSGCACGCDAVTVSQITKLTQLQRQWLQSVGRRVL